MSSYDKSRYRKTYSFFRAQPIFASGVDSGGSADQLWYSTIVDSIYTTGSVLIRGESTLLESSYDVGDNVFFYVSGTTGLQGLQAEIGVFGGDLLTSGTFFARNGITGSLTKLFDGTSAFIAGSGISITSASNGSVTISASGGAGSGDVAGPGSSTANAVALFDGVTGKIVKNSGLTTDGSNSLFIAGTLGVSGSTIFGADVVPSTDITYDLGSSTKRWANVYTGDLHLRNDRGNWTIVEETDYLCVVNNITGKKYKMMLEPIE